MYGGETQQIVNFIGTAARRGDTVAMADIHRRPVTL